MAKINIVGKAAVITANAGFEDIKLLERFNPEALKLKENDEVVFKIGTTCGEGSINQYGVLFDGVSRDGSGKATLTLFVEDGDEDVKEAIADEFGTALSNLKKLEETIPEAVRSVKAAREAIIADITVA